jgi:hypothetical protein
VILTGRSDESDHQPSPREVLAAALAVALGSGDLTLARVAHEALGRLLAEPEEPVPAVADLAAERAKRKP